MLVMVRINPVTPFFVFMGLTTISVVSALPMLAAQPAVMKKNSFTIVDSCGIGQSAGSYQPCTYFYDSLSAMSKDKYGDKLTSWFKVKAILAKSAEKDGYAPPNQGMAFINTLSGNAIVKDFSPSILGSAKALGVNYVISFYLLRSDVKFESSYNVGFMGFGGGSKQTWRPVFELQYTIGNASTGKVIEQGILNGEDIVAENKSSFNAFGLSGAAKGGYNVDTTKLQMAIADSAAKQLLEKFNAVLASR
jgi:hypothetical protein